VPEGWWRYEPGHPFFALYRGFLESHTHILERHWAQAWREGRV
jgi:hypothetical protein